MIYDNNFAKLCKTWEKKTRSNEHLPEHFTLIYNYYYQLNNLSESNKQLTRASRTAHSNMLPCCVIWKSNSDFPECKESREVLDWEVEASEEREFNMVVELFIFWESASSDFLELQGCS